ncbi:polysulfide reductase NrfD, partial [bacterium]|nr:polysulfide reductase NrfD [bacterium]
MAQYGMLIDLDKCTGCRSCMEACKVENNTPQGVLWMYVFRFEEGKYPNTRLLPLPRPCMHCDNAPCAKVCPVGARYKREDGLVATDWKRCIGCRYCMVSCPYGVNYANWKDSKKNLYMDWENKAVSRIAELLTVVSLILAGFVILPDMGRPWRGIVNLFLYARPQSPFFGTFTLVIAGYLFASLVYLYLDGRRDAAICARRITGWRRNFYRLWAAGYKDTPAEQERHNRASFWLGIAILPLLVTAHSTLGFIFGLQVARPGWFSALQAPGFVILAGVSGVGLLIVIVAILRRLMGAKEQLNLDV